VAARRAHALVLVVDARRRVERLLEPPGAIGPIYDGSAQAVKTKLDIKLNCALEGTPAVPPNPQDPGSVAFVHTISCDDTILSSLGPVHSKLQFNTQGTVNLATGFFTETSTPIPNSGTGLFQGVTEDGSYLSIEGRIFPTGAIDMTFTGQACY
jgi:hypothetical protein